jgi:hypothetical protein
MIPLAQGSNAPTRLVASDLDGDGDIDFRIRTLQGENMWSINDGRGFFSPPMAMISPPLAIEPASGSCRDDTKSRFELPGEIVYFDSSGVRADAVWLEANGVRGLQRTSCTKLNGESVGPDLLVFSQAGIKSFSFDGRQLVMLFKGTLKSSDAVVGPYRTIPAAQSPFVVPISQILMTKAQFYLAE